MSGLKYRILWVDDNIETFIELSIDKGFEEFLEGLGFIPEIVKFETEDKVIEHLKSDRKFDLILSDFNLADNGRGDSLISRIRGGQIFTEVLFYSGQANFIETAMNLYQDRVSFFSLESDEGFREFKRKVIRLIELTISKLQEINSVRGLVMSETSELDNNVIEILQSYFEKDFESKADFRAYIIKAIQDSAKGNYKKSEKLENLDDKALLNSRLFDASKKARAIEKLIEMFKMDEVEAFSNFYERYKEHVLDKRNLLAHVKSGVIDDIEYLITGDGEGKKIDQEECIAIRKNLKTYSGLLKDIKNKITA